jgi:DNA-binding response OmpR family regulator
MPQHSLVGGRVLVVEDDYSVAFDLRIELVRRGAEVIGPVGQLDAAVELARSAPRIDAAVIDINLNGEFAFHLVDELVRRDVPVLFATGYEPDVVPYRLRHIAHYLKPAVPSEIAQGLADLVAEQRSRIK